jgi:hypothetical protein
MAFVHEQYVKITRSQKAQLAPIESIAGGQPLLYSAGPTDTHSPGLQC